MSIITFFCIFLIFSIDISNSGRKRKGPKKVKIDYGKEVAIAGINKYRSQIKPEVKNFAPRSFTIKWPPFEKVNMCIAWNQDEFCRAVVTTKQFKNRPRFFWRNNRSKFYMLFLTNTRPYYQAYGYYHYHNWIVGNIPGCNIEEGQEIMRYRAPNDPGTPLRPMYRVWVYEQPGKIHFEEYGKSLSREFTTVDNFTAKYNMTYPFAWNTYYVDDQMGNSTTFPGGTFGVPQNFKLP